MSFLELYASVNTSGQVPHSKNATCKTVDLCNLKQLTNLMQYSRTSNINTKLLSGRRNIVAYNSVRNNALTGCRLSANCVDFHCVHRYILTGSHLSANFVDLHCVHRNILTGCHPSENCFDLHCVHRNTLRGCHLSANTVHLKCVDSNILRNPPVRSPSLK